MVYSAELSTISDFRITKYVSYELHLRTVADHKWQVGEKRSILAAVFSEFSELTEGYFWISLQETLFSYLTECQGQLFPKPFFNKKELTTCLSIFLWTCKHIWMNIKIVNQILSYKSCIIQIILQKNGIKIMAK